MIRIINGRRWYCCPECGQKLHILAPGALCIGVVTRCRRCRWEGEMNIQKED